MSFASLSGALILVAGLVFSLWSGPILALLGGAIAALLMTEPLRAQACSGGKHLLTLLVIALGAGAPLSELLELGGWGLLGSGLVIAAVLALSALAARGLKMPLPVALLVGAGTAICGASAIAATGVAMRARERDMLTAMGTVLALNGVALVVLPPLGHALGLDPHAFGVWAGAAIHDVASVVGAAEAFDPAAVPAAITTKLARTLWIVPVSIGVGMWAREKGADRAPVSVPWGTLGFVAASAAVSLLPALRPWGERVAEAAHPAMAPALFLLGTRMSPKGLLQAGFRPLVLGLALWAVVLGLSYARLG